jgi:hypothetical protein
VAWASEYDPQTVYVVEKNRTLKEVRSKAGSRDGCVGQWNKCTCSWCTGRPARVNNKNKLVADALN